MKTLKIFFILAFVFTISCKNKEQQNKRTEEKVAIEVKHYVCANKCKNSGGDISGNCPVCKTPYVHNQAYHNNEFLKNGPLNVPKNNQNPNANNSPAQNSLGIYHYTCNNGCYGGSGSATNCTNCGTQLIHNQAYHTN